MKVLGLSGDRRSTRARLAAALMAVAATMSAGFSVAKADEVAFDDFESLGPNMLPFDLTDDYFRPGGMIPFADGTDWSKDFPTGWTLDNSGSTYNTTDLPGEFDGWSVMDVTSWIAHAGVQAGRDRCYFGEPVIDGTQYRNNCLVADPDELDDNTNCDPNLFNSYITRAYDVSTADLASLELMFDWDFITDGNQTGVVDVSFDGGTTWQNLLTITDTSRAYGTFTADADSGLFTAASGAFTPAPSATEMLVRFGCVNAGNNWWFAVDNIGLSDVNGVIAFEDFEDMAETLVPFNYAVNGAPTQPTFLPDFQPSDGTDWTTDLSSIGWTIINSGPADMPTKKMYFETAEGAYNGAAVLDAYSWSYQTSDRPPTPADDVDIYSGWGQGRSMFRDQFFGLHNSVLVFDGDQAFDDVIPGSESNDPDSGVVMYNSFAQKIYDLKNFDNDSVTIELEWEMRIEAPQHGVIEVSFDGGKTWGRIFDLDCANLDAETQATFAGYLDPDSNSNGVIDPQETVRTFSTGPQTLTVSDFYTLGNVPDSNKMWLRIGCIDTRNNWWFAVDNIRVSANPQGYVIGDANNDGNANFADINPGVGAILSGTYLPQMDVNEDNAVNFADLNGFVNAILGN